MIEQLEVIASQLEALGFDDIANEVRELGTPEKTKGERRRSRRQAKRRQRLAKPLKTGKQAKPPKYKPAHQVTDELITQIRALGYSCIPKHKGGFYTRVANENVIYNWWPKSGRWYDHIQPRSKTGSVEEFITALRATATGERR